MQMAGSEDLGPTFLRHLTCVMPPFRIKTRIYVMMLDWSHSIFQFPNKKRFLLNYMFYNISYQ